jgi:uncharacterized protein (TIGR00369 family)
MSRERTYSYETAVISPQERRSLSGLEVMQKILAGELPMAAMADTLDFRLVEVAEGSVVFLGEPWRFAYNMHGAVHGGWAATLLDSAMGCAVQTIVPRGFGYTTVDLTINYVRATTESTGELRAEGKVLHGGRRIATAEGRLLDRQNRLVAHGLTTCMLFEIAGDS